MLFIHTIDDVLSGRKTSTRRIVQVGDLAYYRQDAPTRIHTVVVNGRIKWRDGCDYAVQPGRGKKSVGRIRITGIRCEDVRNISHEDALAEGFDYPIAFLAKWSDINRLKFQFYFDPAIVDYRVLHNRRWDIMSYHHVQRILMGQPAQHYQAWVLDFVLLKETVAV